MKAAVMQDVGKPIEILTDIDIIEPRAGEVKVRVHYCSVCHSDLHVLHGELPTYGPTVLGHEAAGVVESVGPGVTRLAPGDHVVLTPVPPCGSCYFCLRSQPCR